MTSRIEEMRQCEKACDARNNDLKLIRYVPDDLHEWAIQRIEELEKELFELECKTGETID